MAEEKTDIFKNLIEKLKDEIEKLKIEIEKVKYNDSGYTPRPNLNEF